MERKMIKALLEGLTKKARSLHPDDIAAAQIAECEVLIRECDILKDIASRKGGFPNTSLKIKKLQKELEEIKLVCLFSQEGRVVAPPNLEEFVTKLEELKVRLEYHEAEEFFERLQMLQEEDNKRIEELKSFNEEINKDLAKKRQTLEDYFHELRVTEANRLETMKKLQEQLDLLTARIESLNNKIKELEVKREKVDKQLTVINTVIQETQESLAKIDTKMSQAKQQVVDACVNVTVGLLRDNNIEVTPTLESRVRQETTKAIDEIGIENLTSEGVNAPDRVIPAVIRALPISQEAQASIVAAVEKPTPIMQDRLTELKAKTETLLEEMKGLAKQKRELKGKLDQAIGSKEDLEKQLQEIDKHIQEHKEEKAKLESQAKKLQKELDQLNTGNQILAKRDDPPTPPLAPQ